MAYVWLQLNLLSPPIRVSALLAGPSLLRAFVLYECSLPIHQQKNTFSSNTVDSHITVPSLHLTTPFPTKKMLTVMLQLGPKLKSAR